MKNIVQIENNFKINFFIHSIQLKSINLNVSVKLTNSTFYRMLITMC